MSQKDQIFAYWAKQLGYLKDAQIKEWEAKAISFEQYIQETSLLRPFQMKGIQLLFVRHCLWSEMQRQQLMTTEKVQQLLAGAIEKFKSGELGTHFTDAEKTGLNLGIVHQIAQLYYQKKVFSEADFKISEQMLQEAKISMSAASINLDAPSPSSPSINSEDLYRRALEAAGEADQTVGRLNLVDFETSAGDGLSNSQSNSNYFGPYEILSEIGVGGMGKVYKARDTELDKIVAVKVMLSDGEASEKEKQRFITEAQVMAKLQHRNIVRVFSAGQYEGKNYIAMDFVEGNPLSKLIKKGKFTPKQCLKIMLQICSAMGYAHKHKIIHRDLKPGNVMITKDNRALVMDFGLAKNVEGGKKLTKSGELLGTPQYMSPEQAGGETRKFRPATDVYALGTIMYEMLTGKPTADGDSTYSIIFSILNKEIIPLRQIKPNIARDLETICLKALEKDPRRRYNHAGLLGEDIKRYLDGEIIEARRASLAYRWKKKILRQKWLAAACIVIIAAVMTLYNYSKEEERKKIQKAKEQKWVVWWEDFIQTTQQDKKRLTHYQEELKTALFLLRDLHTRFLRWQEAGRQDMESDGPAHIREAWGEADNAYQEQKQKIINLLVQEQNSPSVVDNLIQLATRYEELALQIPPIKRIHKKMENKFLSSTFSDFESKYVLTTHNVNDYNPANVLQEIIYHIHIEKYIQKSRQIIEASKIKNSELLKKEEKINFGSDLSLFEQQKIYLHYILLFDHNEVMVKRYHQGFSIPSSLVRLQQISQAKYRSIMERIIQNQSPSLEILDNFRYQLHEVCMINTDFASPYYRIARFLQQVSGRHQEANWYFQKSIRKSKQSDFFVLYFQLNSLYEIFMSDIRDSDRSTFGQYKQNRAQFRASQNAFNKISIGPAQKDYQKLNQVYEEIWNYVEQFFQPQSPIYNKKYFGNKDLTEINDSTDISISGKWYNFPFCPPGSEYQDTKTFDYGIAMYLRLIKKLNEIKDDNLAIAVALRKAQVYEDLARLTHLRGWDLIQIPPELKEVKKTVSMDQVYTNYHKVLAQDSFEVTALEGLAENYGMLGDFSTSGKFFRRLKQIRPVVTNQYMIGLLNRPPSLENAEEIEKLVQRKPGSKPENLSKFRNITVMTNTDNTYDYEKQMAIHNLAFTYSVLGEHEKLAEIKEYLYPVRPDKVGGHFTRVAVSAYTALVSTVLALKEGDQNTAEACCHILWEALLSQNTDIKQAARMGKLVLPYLRHYRNPFLAPSRYQVMPGRLQKIAKGFGQEQQDLNSHFTNQIGIINQLLYFLEDDPKIFKQFSQLMKKTTGIDGAIFTVLYYLSNKTVDIMEIRLDKTSVSSSPSIVYRRSIMFFRKFLRLNKANQLPDQQREYLKQIVQTLLTATYQDPSQYKYHYSLAVAAGYLSKTEKKYRTLAVKHLKYAAQLGMKNSSLVQQEPAFSHLKEDSRWQEAADLMDKDLTFLEEKSLSSWQNHVKYHYGRKQFKDVLLQTRLLSQKIDHAASNVKYRAVSRLKDVWQQKFADNKASVKQQIHTIFDHKKAEEVINLLEKN